MAIIKAVRGKEPVLGSNCYLCDNVVITGDVIMGDNCSVWYNAVIRGDVNYIRIGNDVNIQDGAVLHCNYKDSVTILGDRVSVGHNAIIHGAELEHDIIVGMGAIIMDHAHVGHSSIIAAGSVVTKHTVIEPGSVYGGTPAKLIKKYDPEELNRMTRRSAEHYIMYTGWYRE
ncbi:MAG: gamma carbonic anhydrase family protein [Bacteroidales bacterium]|nr:gamma carbonic anhydrase family protein [Bacteroidales bacterium]